MCSFIIHLEPIANDSLPSGVNDRVINSSCFLYLASPNDAVYFCKCVFTPFTISFNIVSNGILCTLAAILAKARAPLSKKQPERRGL